MREIWVERLIREYRDGKKALEEYRAKLNREDPADDVEYEIVTGMISDMQYALEWMRRGRRPGNRRGVERQSVYQRTALLDPALFPSLDLEPSRRTLTDWEKRQIVDILWALSERERQCFILHMSYGMSYAEIAAELKISKRSVQEYISRAKEKIYKKIS